MIAIITFLILFILLFWVVLRLNKPSDTEVWHSIDRDNWHKSQGHIKQEETLMDFRFGRSGRWEDSEGNDVTDKSRL